MKAIKRTSVAAPMRCAWVMAGLVIICIPSMTAEQPAATAGDGAKTTASACEPAKLGSPYIPVDSWMYPAMLRLYSLGYVDTVYLGLRPWTRASVMHMLEEAGNPIEDSEAESDPARTKRGRSTMR